MIGYWIAGAAAAALAIWALIHQWRSAGKRTSKVVKLSGYRSRKSSRASTPAKSGSQLCSSCRKPAARLSFYADEDGRVIGLCRECKPAAERRKLDRL